MLSLSLGLYFPANFFSPMKIKVLSSDFFYIFIFIYFLVKILY